MKRALAAAAGVVLLAWLLFGSATDLGAVRLPMATAVLLLACGAGLLMRGGTCARSRGRDAIALAALALARGPLCDAACAILPGGARSGSFALALTLIPAGLALGRLLRGSGAGALAWTLAGAGLGALASAAGAAGWAPAWAGVPLAVALVWWLARPAGQLPAEPRAAEACAITAASPVAFMTSAALLVGAALALVAICFRRVVPAYASPSVHPATDVLLVLLCPAALVAWPAGVLARGRAARFLGALGGLMICAAAWMTVDSLGLYENAIALVGLKRQFHARALETGGLLLDWHVWLLSFAGALAAALGVAAGALRGARAVGAALVGAGCAQLAECLLIAPESRLGTDPMQAPLHLLLAASACGAVLVPVFLFGRRGWLALPLAVLPFLDWHPGEGPPWISTESLRQVAGFDEVRRPGEYGVEDFQRTLLADVTVFSTPGPDSHALEGRDAFTQTLSPRSPAFRLGPAGELLSVLAPSDAAEEPARAEGDAPDAAPPEPEPRIERFYGVRVAGRALHREHQPLGAEGSMSRLTRLFASPGRLLACGVGAELVAADLHDSGQAGSASVASPVPLGQRPLQLLLDHLGSSGWQAARIDEPQVALRATPAASVDTLVVAPCSEALPGVAELCTVQSVERMERLLAPAGRCLLWLDTQDMGGRELGARLAAFGAVFGERSAAFVEPRELDAPFVLLLGWKDEAGQPARAALQAQLPGPDATGFRSRLRRAEDLASLLLRDGRGMAELAAAGPVHARSRPITEAMNSEAGWAAVRDVAQEHAALEAVVRGAEASRPASRETFAGLAMHSRYAYRLAGLNDTLLEIKPDVNWAAFDEEVACYARAAMHDPDDPLLQLALAALLEPLVLVGDLTRFASAYESCHAEQMRSWRLALQEAWVRRQGLQAEESEAALERARGWAEGR